MVSCGFGFEALLRQATAMKMLSKSHLKSRQLARLRPSGVIVLDLPSLVLATDRHAYS